MYAVEDFRRNGYQIVRGMLDTAALADIRRFLESRVAREIASACGEIGCTNPADFVSYIAKQAATSGSGLSKGTRDTLSGHFSLQTRLSQELWNVPRNARFRGLLQEVLGTKLICMHMPPTARFVLPGNHFAGVPAHQDVSYNHHMTDFITAWVPFVDIDAHCGGVRVFQGSNAEKEFLETAETDKFWLKSVPSEGFRAEACEMRVGDVLLLSKWILHESMPNLSERTRISTDFRFFAETERSTKHFLDMQTWKVIAPEVAA